jgi:hypothetical protein
MTSRIGRRDFITLLGGVSGGLGHRSNRPECPRPDLARDNGRRSTPVMVSRTPQVALPVSQTASAASSGQPIARLARFAA